MNFNRLLGIVGIALSIVGLLVVENATIAGAAFLLIGLALCGWAAWLLFGRRAVVRLGLSYRYTFVDPEATTVRVERRECIRIQARNITSLWARNLTASGKCRNFTTNLGSVSKVDDLGGTVQVRVDSDVPFRLGEHDWLLTYEGDASFPLPTETVRFICLIPSDEGALELTFHPSRLPPVVERLTHRNGELEVADSPIVISPSSRTATWKFKPQLGTEYVFRWTWPDR